MTAQVSTRNVTLASVVRDPAFRQGFADRIRGRQLAYDHEWQGNRNKTATDKAWAYERGRLFAAFCQGEGIQLDPKQWFINRRLNWRVLDAAGDALRCGAIR
jgi:hypothetical protein